MDADIFDQFIDQLGRYVRERLIPAEKDILESDVIPDAIVDEMRELGLFGLTTPEEYGGAADHRAIYPHNPNPKLRRAPATGRLSINIGMVCSALKNGGTEEQKAEWLPRLAAGEIASFGLTEPGSGSDSAAMQTSAVKSGNG